MLISCLTSWVFHVDSAPVLCLPACLPACLFFPFGVVYVLLFDLVIKTQGAHAFRSDPGAHGVRSRARSVPGADRVRSRAQLCLPRYPRLSPYIVSLCLQSCADPLSYIVSVSCWLCSSLMPACLLVCFSPSGWFMFFCLILLLKPWFPLHLSARPPLSWQLWYRLKCFISFIPNIKSLKRTRNLMCLDNVSNCTQIRHISVSFSPLVWKNNIWARLFSTPMDFSLCSSL